MNGAPDCYLPFDMLVAALVVDGCLIDVDDVIPSKIAHWVGVSRQTVYRWKANGQLTFHIADQIASRMHVHPSQIWGDLYWQADLSVGAP
jgi:hypothetical protein